ncbi:MAG: alpha/beta hydrolase [Actinobacteria bacterium]|nr:alpha/beta hydrolase [Actinomycetota bacterium]
MRRLLVVALVSSVTLLGIPAGATAQPVSEAPPQADARSEVSPRAEAQPTLRWRACDVAETLRAQCAHLTVPRDWARADSGTYRIAVARIRAAVAPTRGVLLFNPGGPGVAGLDALNFVHGRLPKVVRDSYDVVAFDPRATGSSQPVLNNCRVAEPSLPATGPVDWEAVTEDYVGEMSEALQACLAVNKTTAASVGSWQVIRDIDQLRRALGAEKITFWGMSYGTTLGRAYAQQFPQRLQALILDGAITPTPAIGDYAREHIWDDATAIQTMLGAFGAKSQRAYWTVMRFLERGTLEVGNGRELTRWSVTLYLTNGAAYQSHWDDMRATLNVLYDAIRNSRTVTREQYERITTRPETGRSEDGSSPVFHFVNCSDMHDRPSVQVLAGAAEQAAKVGVTGMGLISLNEGIQCAGLPALGRSVPPLTTPLRLATPPIVINSVGDNRTPWLGARATANLFTGSSMVTYAGTQHVTYGGPSRCVNAAVTPYLLYGTVPARSVACPLEYP